MRYATNRSGRWAIELLERGAHMVDGGDYDVIFPDQNCSNAMALDRRGAVHVTYAAPDGKGLKHGSNESGIWKFDFVDTSGDMAFSSLEADPAGGLHAAYYDLSSKVIKYARRDNKRWRN
ncbi:MAG: hypothetical protein M5R36_12295 [Deltaproteobacteria bacterium]|nr:hypothetical protein [Deltaproteobacteria bacterium]